MLRTIRSALIVAISYCIGFSQGGTVIGYITTNSAALESALVIGDNGSLKDTAFSNSSGYYSLSVGTGLYTFWVEKPGYYNSNTWQWMFAPNDSIMKNIDLTPLPSENQLISSTGQYSFDSTDITINILSLSGSDSISTVLHDNEFPPNLPGIENPIKRYYEISAGAGITALNTIIELSYTQSEFEASDITDESSLYCARYDGSSWVAYNSIVDTLNNTVSCTTNGFSTWSIGGTGGALPVTLSGFSGSYIEGIISITWSTIDESHNLKWELYKKTQGETDYLKIYEAAATITLNGGNYSFQDQNIQEGSAYSYQLADVDLQGLKTFHPPITLLVSSTGIADAGIESNAKNSNNAIFNIRGQRISEFDINNQGHTPGIYFIYDKTQSKLIKGIYIK